MSSTAPKCTTKHGPFPHGTLIVYLVNTPTFLASRILTFETSLGLWLAHILLLSIGAVPEAVGGRVVVPEDGVLQTPVEELLH